MTKAKKPAEKPKDKKSLKVYMREDESEDATLARTMAAPETNAGLTIKAWQTGTLPEEIDVNATINELKEQTKALKAGKMDRAEEMLLSQAQTLDELFNTLARRAHRCEYLSQFEANLKLSLKAQNQCRMTLETLSNIKNPPVVYAKQANIAHGPQQVNNGNAHAAENRNELNELLEHIHAERLDTRTTGETIGSYSSVEALA